MAKRINNYKAESYSYIFSPFSSYKYMHTKLNKKTHTEPHSISHREPQKENLGIDYVLIVPLYIIGLGII